MVSQLAEGAMVLLALVIIAYGVKGGLQALGEGAQGVGTGAGSLASGLGSLLNGAGSAIGSVLGGLGRAASGLGEGAGRVGSGLGEGLGSAATGLGRGIGAARRPPLGRAGPALYAPARPRPGFLDRLGYAAGGFLAGAAAAYLWQHRSGRPGPAQGMAPAGYPVDPTDAQAVEETLNQAGIPHQWHQDPSGIPYVVVDPDDAAVAEEVLGAAGFEFDGDTADGAPGADPAHEWDASDWAEPPGTMVYDPDAGEWFSVPAPRAEEQVL
jgi:hypothetical protein